jgi:hypothetical protein
VNEFWICVCDQIRMRLTLEGHLMGKEEGDKENFEMDGMEM